MKSLNPNIHPHEGFFFKDADGARIFGDTWAGVIARVRKYRARAGYAPGNPEEEVTQQACARNPVLCNNDPQGHAAHVQNLPLKSRVLTWLNNLTNQKDKQFVEEGLARERAAVCAKCSKNVGLPGGCASCKAALNHLRKQVLDKRFQDGRINACEVLGEDLPTVVHLEIQTVENSALPAPCWRRRSI